MVYLVDHRVRDLMGSALVAHHLGERGIDCILEPIEAYRGCLAAHKPDMIIFNHLFAGHLVEYSWRLHEIGVKVGLLLNEGLLQNRDFLEFSSGKFHRPHVDLFMCWNKSHHDSLLQSPFFSSSKIITTGTPRFDYYFPPYKKIYNNPFPEAWRRDGASILLLCTNFGFAPYHKWPQQHLSFADSWARRLPSYEKKDTATRAAIHYAARERFFDFAQALIDKTNCFLAIRPHPREPHSRHLDWIASLDDAARQRVLFVPSAEIAALINWCDVEISCDTCTTTLEAWIANKPTIALKTSGDDSMVNKEQWVLSTTCDSPGQLPALLASLPGKSPNPELMARRAAFIDRLCGSPDGRSAQQIAESVFDLLTPSRSPIWNRLTSSDRKRGYKLLALKRLGFPYNFDPLLAIKRKFAHARYAIKIAAYDKAIIQADVMRARKRISDALAGIPDGNTDE